MFCSVKGKRNSVFRLYFSQTCFDMLFPYPSIVVCSSCHDYTKPNAIPCRHHRVPTHNQFCGTRPRRPGARFSQDMSGAAGAQQRHASRSPDLGASREHDTPEVTNEGLADSAATVSRRYGIWINVLPKALTVVETYSDLLVFCLFRHRVDFILV